MAYAQADCPVDVVGRKVTEGNPSGVDHFIEWPKFVGFSDEANSEVDVDVFRFVPPGRDQMCVDPSEVGSDPVD